MKISIKSLTEGPGQLLRRAYQMATSLAQQNLNQFELTPLQFGVLIVLSERPGMDAKTLSEMLALDRASLTGILDRMEASGLITREMNPEDRRGRVLGLTPAGANTFRRSSAIVVQGQYHILDGLTPSERKTFMELLSKLVRVQSERVKTSSSGARDAFPGI